MAGRRETDDLKPIDKAIFRVVASHQARNESERIGGPEILNPEAELSV